MPRHFVPRKDGGNVTWFLAIIMTTSFGFLVMTVATSLYFIVNNSLGFIAMTVTTSLVAHRAWQLSAMRVLNNFSHFTKRIGLFTLSFFVLFSAAHPVLALEAAKNNGETTEAEIKPAENKPAENKTAENKLVENTSVEAKPVEVNQFDIFEYQVEGNTKLSNVQIEKAVYKHLGEGKTFADVTLARDALEKTYQEAGYLTVLVDIPEQEVNKKVVKLNVTEGRVGRLRVKDSDYYSLGRIKQLASSVREGEVPHFPTVQKDIARLNRTADKRVTPVMKAGKKFGTVDVELKVEDNLPLHYSLELNDRYSQDTTRWRLGGAIRYDNLWQRDHSLSLNFLTSPQNTDEVKVLSANYLMRFDESDALLAVYGVRSKSDVSTVGGINILGDGTILGARLIKPLPSVDNYFHSLSLGIDYKHFGQTAFEFGADAGESQSPATYAPISASYTGTWQTDTSSTQLTTGVNVGLRGFVAKEAEFESKRQGAKPNFFIAKLELQHTKNFANGAQGLAKIDGQFTGSPLISNEQYLAGGLDTVRGYLESQASGDRAVHSTIEIHSPPLLKNISWLKDFKVAGFYDIARIHTLASPAQFDTQIGIETKAEIKSSSDTLSGVGVGVQLKAIRNINMNWYLAWPLNDNGVTKKGDLASHLRVWYEF